MKTLFGLLALVTAASCWTYENGKFVSNAYGTLLDFKNFNGSITKNFFADLQGKGVYEVYLGNNTIHNIEDGALCFSSPYAITAFDNYQMPNFTKEMFGLCPNLRELHLQGSEYAHLDKNLLSTLPNLEEFSLEAYPSIEEITAENFNGLEQLRVLWLLGTNLRKINAEVFNRLENLQDLYIINGQLETIEGVFANAKLEKLNLRNNKFKTFPWDALKNLRNLLWLNLNGNSITQYNATKIAEYMPKLQQFGYTTANCAESKALAHVLRLKLNDTHFFNGVNDSDWC